MRWCICLVDLPFSVEFKGVSMVILNLVRLILKTDHYTC